MGELRRELLPDPAGYFASVGVDLVGCGEWRTGPCEFHGGSDSLRVNTNSGGWACMACGAKGDLIEYEMRNAGTSFRDACIALGAWVDDGKPDRVRKRNGLTHQDAVRMLRTEVMVVFVIGSDMARRLRLSERDKATLNEAVRRIGMVLEGLR